MTSALTAMLFAMPLAAAALGPNPVSLLHAEIDMDPTVVVYVNAAFCAEPSSSCEGVHLERVLARDSAGALWSLGDAVAIRHRQSDPGRAFTHGGRRVRFDKLLLFLALTSESALTDGQKDFKAKFIRSLSLSPARHRDVKTSELAFNYRGEAPEDPIKILSFTLSAEVLPLEDPSRGFQKVEIEFGGPSAPQF